MKLIICCPSLCIDRGSEITCGDPPSLPDGKICGNFKAPHKQWDKVRYACGINFTIKGNVKTCENGQWTGETRCLGEYSLNL